jgi:hypothetical protein
MICQKNAAILCFIHSAGFPAFCAATARQSNACPNVIQAKFAKLFSEATNKPLQSIRL